MNLNFTFNHTAHLSLVQLQSIGIRSPKELEEVFSDPDSTIKEITLADEKPPVFMAIGFSLSMNPILYVFLVEDTIISLFARKASKEEMKQYFCGK